MESRLFFGMKMMYAVLGACVFAYFVFLGASEIVVISLMRTVYSLWAVIVGTVTLSSNSAPAAKVSYRIDRLKGILLMCMLYLELVCDIMFAGSLGLRNYSKL